MLKSIRVFQKILRFTLSGNSQFYISSLFKPTYIGSNDFLESNDKIPQLNTHPNSYQSITKYGSEPTHSNYSSSENNKCENVSENKAFEIRGRNSRMPKKPNHGKRPCSSFMRKLKKKMDYNKKGAVPDNSQDNPKTSEDNRDPVKDVEDKEDEAENETDKSAELSEQTHSSQYEQLLSYKELKSPIKVETLKKINERVAKGLPAIDEKERKELLAKVEKSLTPEEIKQREKEDRKAKAKAKLKAKAKGKGKDKDKKKEKKEEKKVAAKADDDEESKGGKKKGKRGKGGDD